MQDLWVGLAVVAATAMLGFSGWAAQSIFAIRQQLATHVSEREQVLREIGSLREAMREMSPGATYQQLIAAKFELQDQKLVRVLEALSELREQLAQK